MSEVIPFPDPERINDEAADWIVRLDAEALTPEVRAALDAWLARDPRNSVALRRLATVWWDLDRLQALEALFPRDPAPSVATSGPAPGWRQLLTGAHIRRAAALLVVLGLAWAGWHGNMSGAAEKVFRAPAGQQARVLLDDGSRLILNTRTEVRVRLSADQRIVRLVQGDVYVEVARREHVPFVVRAGHGQVRALGTAFGVRLRGDTAEVIVAHGSVEVAAATDPGGDGPDPATVVLQPGDAVRYARTLGSPIALAAPELAAKLAWKDGKWVFNGQTLAEVIAEVGRYSETRIDIADPTLRDLRIGGYFDMGDLERFLDALEAGFGVGHTRVSADHILLTAKDGRPHGS